MVRWSLAFIAVLGTIALFGTVAAAGGGCHSTDATTSQARGIAVDIRTCKFNPVVLFAPVGATVNWAQNDVVPHNVVGLGWGDGGSFINNGSSTAHTFTNAGIYPYHCTLHPDMSGVVIVGEVDLGGAGAVTAARGAEPSALVAAATATSSPPPAELALAGAGAAGLLVTTGLAFALGRRSRMAAVH